MSNCPVFIVRKGNLTYFPYLCIKQIRLTMDKNIVIYNFMDTFYCCEVRNEKFCEEMVTEHMLVYLCSGEMDLIESNGRLHHLTGGDAFFVPRNHKMRKVKYPAKNGVPFKGLFLFLKVSFLRKVLAECRLSIDSFPQYKGKSPYVLLDSHPFLAGLFKSLELYFDAREYPSELLMESKLKEAVLALLQLRPDLAPVLFDCAKPWKIDLREFMNEHFASDLDLRGFAHYTGRSLTAFKKDFEQAFQTSPMKWIVRRRLDEARQLIEQQGEKPLDVYQRVGFKNLSHFSTAYKRAFGHPPSIACP